MGIWVLDRTTFMCKSTVAWEYGVGRVVGGAFIKGSRVYTQDNLAVHLRLLYSTIHDKTMNTQFR